MNKRILIIAAICLLILLIILFPKKIGSSGGFSGGGDPTVKQCKCIGYHYSSYQEGCADCFQTEFCIGIPYSCGDTWIEDR